MSQHKSVSLLTGCNAVLATNGPLAKCISSEKHQHSHYVYVRCGKLVTFLSGARTLQPGPHAGLVSAIRRPLNVGRTWS